MYYNWALIVYRFDQRCSSCMHCTARGSKWCTIIIAQSIISFKFVWNLCTHLATDFPRLCFLLTQLKAAIARLYACMAWVTVTLYICMVYTRTYAVDIFPFLSIFTAIAVAFFATPYVFDMAHPATIVPWPAVSTFRPPAKFLPYIYIYIYISLSGTV